MVVRLPRPGAPSGPTRRTRPTRWGLAGSSATGSPTTSRRCHGTAERWAPAREKTQPTGTALRERPEVVHRREPPAAVT
jgi:hypothetical protein